MLEVVRFTNLAAATFDFNTDLVPLNHFEVEPNVRTSRRNKAQAHGTWPGHTYMGEALIHMEGQIFGTDSSDFNTRKLLMLSTIYPDPTAFITDYPLGTLTVQLTGMTETATADCTIDGPISTPMEGLSPSRCDLQITWVIFTGYFTGDTSGDPYWIQ